MDLRAQIEQTIATQELLRPGDTIVVAVSGGPDSLTLLHVLLQLAPSWRWRLHVAHLDHGLRKEAADEARMVGELARSWGLGATIERRQVGELAGATNLPEAARTVRYRFLAEVALAQAAQAVAVAHQADDQAETLLHHLLRGSGPEGLAAMRPRSAWRAWRELAGHGQRDEGPALVRPLLETPRAEIERYCAEQGLAPADDPSNRARRYTRTRLRHELLPLLRELNPRVVEALGRTARLAAQQADDLAAILDAAWPQLLGQGEPGSRDEQPEAAAQRARWAQLVGAASGDVVLRRGPWQQLPPTLRRLALRRAVAELDRQASLDAAALDRALAIAAGTGATDLPGGLQLRSSDATIVLRSPRAALAPAVEAPLPVQVPGCTQVTGDSWQLVASFLQTEPHSQGRLSALLDAATLKPPLSLRSRIAGERMVVDAGGRARRIADLMSNAGLPREWRDSWPLLADAQGTLWVPGVAVAWHVHPTPATRTYLLVELR